MASSKIKKNEFRGPFFGDQVNYITGLDQLGLQNTSEATYSTLLPGITNVTNRIRYFGFYCWLLDRYAAEVGSTDRHRYYNFIRRSELLLALIMQANAPEVTHIPGSSFASTLINEAGGGSFFDLSEGADLHTGKKSSTYWKYSKGAFGQYYTGSMRTMGLIVARAEEDQIYIRTDKSPQQKISGLDLAESFGASIPNTGQSLFLDCVEKGKVEVDHLSEFGGSFNMAMIPAPSQELDSYIALLKEKDYPAEIEDSGTYNRSQTLSYLLDFLAKNPEQPWYGLLTDAYNARLSLTPENTPQFGWYFYQLNEYWQFACSTLLWSILKELDSSKYGGQAVLSSFLEDMAERTVQEMVSNTPYLEESTPLHLIKDAETYPLETEEDSVLFIRNNIKQGNTIQVAASAIGLIFKLYQNNVLGLGHLRSYGAENQVLRDGNFVGFMDMLTIKGNSTLRQFTLEFFYRNIISRHQYTAIRKMGAGSQSSQKFILEDPYISLREIVTPQFSMPRLQTLLTMAQDLHLVSIEE